jgi:hypothetical protein
MFQSGSHSVFSNEICEGILANFNVQKHDIMEFLNIIVFDLSSLNSQIMDKKMVAIREKAEQWKSDQIVSAAVDDENASSSIYEFIKTESMDPFFSQIIF